MPVAAGRPDHPPAALRARETGSTRVRLAVSASGEVAELRLVASAGSARLDDAVLAALKTCRFTPALDAQGQPVAAAVSIEYVWKIDPVPADSAASASLDRVLFSGPTALRPHLREPVLRKIQQAGGEADDCHDITLVNNRPLPEGVALPVDRPTDARELWVARRCGVARADVVTLHRQTFSDEIRVWPAGRPGADGTIAPLPTAASITGAQVRADYERARARAGNEYHARQILAPTLEQAQAALDRLRAGEPFAQVAGQVPADAGSAAADTLRARLRRLVTGRQAARLLRPSPATGA